MNKYVVGSVVGVAAVVVLAAGGAAVLLGGDEADQAAPAEETTQAAPIASRPDCPTGPVAGVELECLGSQATEPPADIGVTVVNLWAWWCEPCRAELPHLEEVARTHPEWQVVGVHADENPGNGAAFLEDIGVHLPSYQDTDNTFAGTLELPNVIPITLVLQDGEIKGRYIQPFESTEEIVDAVEEALA